VNLYEGRPTESQITRMGVLAAGLEAAARKFEAAADKEITGLNDLLARKKLEPLAKLGGKSGRSASPGPARARERRSPSSSAGRMDEHVRQWVDTRVCRGSAGQRASLPILHPFRGDLRLPSCI